MSRTFVNLSGSASPAIFPISDSEMHFKKGDVPAGSIAEPQIGGSAAFYQVDSETYWPDDGSLRSIKPRIIGESSLAAGASGVADYVAASGSYSSTSSITIDDLLADDDCDFRVALDNVHTARPEYYNDKMFSVTIGGGEVTSVKTWAPVGTSTHSSTLTGSIASSGGGTVTVTSASGFLAGRYYLVDSEIIFISAVAGPTLTFTSRGQFGTTETGHSPGATIRRLVSVLGGGGSGAYFYVVNGVATIVRPGTGYGNFGAGAFEIAWKDVVTAIQSSSNHSGGRSIEQYAKGPVCDAWRVRTSVSGMPHFHVTFYIERWKKPDGTLLDYLACAVLGNALVDTSNALVNYTYDLTWKNGATVIRGPGTDSDFETVQHYGSGSCGTHDAEGRMDWVFNDAAFKAIEQQLTADECDYYRSTLVALPWLAMTPTITVPTIESAWDIATGYVGINRVAKYAPFGQTGVRAALGSGGGASQEDPMQMLDGLWWQEQRRGNLTAARTYRRNIRVGTLHAMSFGQLGGGIFEPTTMYIPNVIPAAAQTFSGMTPTRETVYSANIIGATTTGGSLAATCGPQPISGSGNITSVSAAMGDSTYHQVNVAYGAWLNEGQQWQLDALTQAAASPIFARTYGTARQASLGATNYYGTYVGRFGNIRVWVWAKRTEMYAVSAMPETWADGTTNVERANIKYCAYQHFKFENDLVAFTGVVKFGTGAAPYTQTKTVDYTGSGIWPEQFHVNLGAQSTSMMVPFMENYDHEVTAHAAVLHYGDATLGDEIKKWRDYRRASFLERWRGAGPHYMATSYRMMAQDGYAGAGAVDPTWRSMGDAVNPKLGAVLMGAPTSGGGTVSCSFAAGSSTITLNRSVTLYSTVKLASGSRFRFSNEQIDAASKPGGTPPSPIDLTVWYYYERLTDTTFRAHTSAALNAPVTALAAASGVYIWFQPAPGTMPADGSAYGTYDNGTSNSGLGRLSEQLGLARLMRACEVLPGDDDHTAADEAIATLETITNALPAGPINYQADPQYAWSPTA